MPKVTPSSKVAEVGIILRQFGSRVHDIAYGSFPTLLGQAQLDARQGSGPLVA